MRDWLHSAVTPNCHPITHPLDSICYTENSSTIPTSAFPWMYIIKQCEWAHRVLMHQDAWHHSWESDEGNGKWTHQGNTIQMQSGQNREFNRVFCSNPRFKCRNWGTFIYSFIHSCTHICSNGHFYNRQSVWLTGLSAATLYSVGCFTSSTTLFALLHIRPVDNDEFLNMVVFVVCSFYIFDYTEGLEKYLLP